MKRPEKPVAGVVVARRVLSPAERAALAALQDPRPAVPALPAREIPTPAASSAGGSSSNKATARPYSLELLRRLAQAVAVRVCPVCGQPITAKSMKIEAGPFYVEIHPRCADPVRRAQKAVHWLNKWLNSGR